MKPTSVLYSCNVTVNPARYNDQILNICKTLAVLRKTLQDINVLGIFFVDTILFFQIKEKNPDIYQEIIEEFKKLNKAGHTIGKLINPIWETVQDLHQIDKERLIDIFAQGKFIIQDLVGDTEQQGMVVRVFNSKIQPFEYLFDVYQLFGVKVDASILPGIKSSLYFDFSNIKSGEITRFSINPNVKERFGNILEIPRSYFHASLRTRVAIKKHLRKFTQQQNEIISYLDENNISLQLISIPSMENSTNKLLSIDVIPPTIFRTIMDKQRKLTKHVCVIESKLEDINSMTIQNLQWLYTWSSFCYVSLQNLIEKYSTTYKIRFK